MQDLQQVLYHGTLISVRVENIPIIDEVQKMVSQFVSY